MSSIFDPSSNDDSGVVLPEVSFDYYQSPESTTNIENSGL